MWDTSDKTVPRHIVKPDRFGVGVVAFQPHTHFLVAGSQYGVVTFYDISGTSEKEIFSLPTLDRGTERISFSDDGKLMTCGGVGEAKIPVQQFWDVSAVPPRPRKLPDVSAIPGGKANLGSSMPLHPSGREMATIIEHGPGDQAQC